MTGPRLDRVGRMQKRTLNLILVDGLPCLVRWQVRVRIGCVCRRQRVRRRCASVDHHLAQSLYLVGLASPARADPAATAVQVLL